MPSISLKQKEARTVRFTCTSNGSAIDLSTATLSFMIKGSKSEADSQARISKTNTDFGKTSAASGIVTLDFSASDLTQAAGTYIGELKAIFTASSIAKSNDLIVVIEGAVIGA
jgi:hypothetical protein